MRVRTAGPADVDAVIEIGTTTWRATYPPITGEAYVAEGIARWWTPEAVLPGIEGARCWWPRTRRARSRWRRTACSTTTP